ncbi:hypothetical protein [Streptomyces sp. NPDC048256]|uniref:hypothetical protein n=1 Tax=unclassified Streptomyces TaxID=2593676 RepID=UPI0033D679F1
MSPMHQPGSVRVEFVEALAYPFWLHRMSRSALEANRFTRDSGITYHPDPAADPSSHRSP